MVLQVRSRFWFFLPVFLAFLFLEGCSSSTPRSAETAPAAGAPPAGAAPPPAQVQTPQLKQTLAGGGEGWLGSPAAADLDGDGRMEIIAPRGGFLFVWHADGTLFWKSAYGFSAETSPATISGRIWGPPVVADLDGDGKLEIAAGSHKETVSVWNWDGKLKAGWPKIVGGEAGSADREIRSLAAGSLGNGQRGLLVSRTRTTKVPVAFLFDSQGTVLPGWPQLSASGGCVLLPAPDANCFEAGTYNQNVGLADLDGDGKTDAIIGYDNAYVGLFHLNGLPFSTPFLNRPFFPGVPAFHDPALAIQGFGPDGEDRSEFTDSPPVVADLDGDGVHELILVGDHERAGITTILGNTLFVFRPNATRFPGFERPFETRDHHPPWSPTIRPGRTSSMLPPRLLSPTSTGMGRKRSSSPRTTACSMRSIRTDHSSGNSPLQVWERGLRPSRLWPT
ncbi:MAG: VCBS repeat-containing protein [Candidatus Manganitrophus sp.]|nr:VCBS repeat-containing protein [Candidatus Manganitrophus sp.]WDT70681.1 MAG: VCBS repeat-containing protein [Candidatus Manganitrophus sp.]WDT82054.1 MAG: VCBS repeat-containing protein [Candidatus Manganitrophus sp.]